MIINLLKSAVLRALLLALAIVPSLRHQMVAAEATAAAPASAPTFNRDIAPLLFKHCAICHRPGQTAPFTLLTFADVKKRASQIMEAVNKKVMPPWAPEPGHGDFLGERRLSSDEIALLQKWKDAGCEEGAAADLPPQPTWPGGWMLGQPDLVVSMPKAYTVPAEGQDLYRNFLIPVPLHAPRYVRAVELDPGNRKVTHHAFIKLDKTGEARRLDGKEAEPGFPGMNIRAQMPDGHFLTWQPGKMPAPPNERLAWRLEPGMDLVVQAHLKPGGKAEPFQASVALYFTDQPPTNQTFKIGLASLAIDIPAGDSQYVVEDEFKLPADAQVSAVFPHAHYLGQDLQGWAILPDGARQSLIWIKDWNPDWQGDYRYANPVFLPRGSVLHMRYVYDNSSYNPQNPNQPPRRTRYGPRMADEMAELWFQMIPARRSQLPLFAREYQLKVNANLLAGAAHDVKADPRDPAAHSALAQLLLGQRRFTESAELLAKAIQLKPDWDEPHYFLGVVHRMREQPAEAAREFAEAVRCNPDNAKAHGYLGMIYREQGKLEPAEKHLQTALRLNPDDKLAREALAELAEQKTRTP